MILLVKKNHPLQDVMGANYSVERILCSLNKVVNNLQWSYGYDHHDSPNSGELKENKGHFSSKPSQDWSLNING